MEQTDRNIVLSLAKKVTEMAELQTSHGFVQQDEFVQAIQRLQIAVEGPAHYVARKRLEVRGHAMAIRLLNV